MNTTTHYTVRHIQGEDLSGRFDYWEQTFLSDMTDAQAIAAANTGNICEEDVEELDPETYDLSDLPDNGTITVFRASDDVKIYSDNKYSIREALLDELHRWTDEELADPDLNPAIAVEMYGETFGVYADGRKRAEIVRAINNARRFDLATALL